MSRAAYAHMHRRRNIHNIQTDLQRQLYIGYQYAKEALDTLYLKSQRSTDLQGSARSLALLELAESFSELVILDTQ